MARVRKWLKDAAVGLGVAAVLLGASEVVLALAGLGRPLPSSGLARGFDSGAAYLVTVESAVPNVDAPGVWMTQIFEGRRPEVVVGPKGERTRVLLFGGSNTESFRDPIVEEVLAETPGAADAYEVINLGRSGYGSARVAILFEQALAALDPDVVVIYSGHNEFVERGFELALEERWSSSWQRALAETARRSRTFNVVVGAFASRRPSPQGRPEAWERAADRFAGTTYDETLERLEGYRANLRRMCELARRLDVGVVLCTVVHNRFAAPFRSTLPDDLGAADRAVFERALAAGLGELPPWLATLLPENDGERPHPKDWTAGEPRTDAPDPMPRIAALRPSTGPLARQPPLYPPPGTRRPKIDAFLADVVRLHARELEPAERAALERAEQRLADALALCPDHPRALFALGLVGHALGREPSTVRARLEDAGAYDRAPQRASRVTNQIVRDVAARDPSILLVDVDALFVEHCADGLPGWEWLLDHCHIHPGAKRVVVRAFLAAMRERWPGDLEEGDR